MTSIIAQRIAEAARPAADHADSVCPGWSNEALLHVRLYAELNDTFIIEDVRLAAERAGLAAPPSRRAWGAVALAARRAGFIQKMGYAMCSAPTANPTPVTLWRSLIKMEAKA